MTGTAQPKSGARSPASAAMRLSAARLATVQALYQMEIAGGEIDDVVAEFLSRRSGSAVAEETGLETDPRLFEVLVRGVQSSHGELDGTVTEALSDEWPFERLEVILRCILRVGAWELINRRAVPARVVISECVDLAHAFYDGVEPGMVNGVLDHLAHRLRPGELEGKNGEPTAPAR